MGFFRTQNKPIFKFRTPNIGKFISHTQNKFLFTVHKTNDVTVYHIPYIPANVHDIFHSINVSNNSCLRYNFCVNYAL